MSVIIYSAPFCNLEALQLNTEKDYQNIDGLRLQKVIDNNMSLSVCDDSVELSAIEKHLKSNTDSQIIFFYSNLPYVLQSVIFEESDLNKAVEKWCECAYQISNLYKRFRKQVRIVDINDVCINYKACKELLGIPINSEPKPYVVSEIFNLSVELLLYRNMKVKKYKAILEACTLTLSPGQINKVFSLEETLLEWYESFSKFETEKNRLTLELQSYRDRNKEVSDENELLITQLHSVQEELESILYKNRNLESNINELSKENTKIQSDCKSLSEENQLLLEQLHYVQEELEEVLINKSNKDNEIEDSVESSVTENLNTIKNKEKNKLGFFEKVKKSFVDSKHASIIEKSSYFDSKWYLETYPDVAKVTKFRKRPALHYLLYGGFEGRNPSANFNSRGYIQKYPDVRIESINPLLHFILHGKAEGRDPQP